MCKLTMSTSNSDLAQCATHIIVSKGSVEKRHKYDNNRVWPELASRE